LEPSVSSSDYLFGVRLPYEWFGVVFIVLPDEAIDCGLQIDQRVENTVLEPSARQFCKKTFDGVEP
jgi:hypothetical protein